MASGPQKVNPALPLDEKHQRGFAPDPDQRLCL